MKIQYNSVRFRLVLSVLLLVLCVPFFSFQYSTPYNIKVDGELIRFLANNHDHSSLNFTNMEEGEVYDLVFNPGLKMPDVFVKSTNVEIIGEWDDRIEFIARKNNIFHFYWKSPQDLKEFYVSVLPRVVDDPSPQPVLKSSSSSLQIVPNVTAATFVDSLIAGNCFEVFDIETNIGSSPLQLGTFSGGLTGIGMDKGVVLTTGKVASVAGTNNSAFDVSHSFNGPGDPDLTDIANVNSKDAITVTFKFIPTVDTVQFKFVWASEEYCTYSASSFTDVCGFFVSGPGINGSYLNGAQNFAKSPYDPPNSSGGNINVNLFSHYNHVDPYYLSNLPAAITPGSSNCVGPPAHPDATGSPSVNELKFNAFSGVFDAIVPIPVPCDTYTIKIAVADGSDWIVDSGFFIQGNSWYQGEPITVEAINSNDNTNQGYETCETYYYEFCKDPASDISKEYTMEFELSTTSTATPGLDYAPIPTSVVIPAGVQCVQVPIETFEDDEIEGQESIIINVEDPCNCSSTEVAFYINDVVPLESDIPDEEICGPGTVSLVANPTGGLPPYSYSWSTGGSAELETVNSSDSPIFVTITDDCGEEYIDNIVITELDVPDAVISGSGSLCPGSGASLDLTVSFSDSGPWEFTYLTNGANPNTITTSSNPYFINVSNPASYTLQNVTNTTSNCPGNVSGIALITTGDLTLNSTEVDPLCFNSSEGSITITTSGGSGNYSYSWSHDGSITGNTATGLSAGTYTISVNDGSSSCSGSIDVVLDNPTEVTSSISTPPLIDCNNPVATLSVTPTGGTGSYFYTWTTSNGNIVSGANSDEITVNQGGDYSVSIEDTNGCLASNSVTVSADLTQPNVVVAPGGTIDCTTTTAMLSGVGSDSGSILWTTSNGNIVSGATTLEPVVDQAGTYTLSITDLGNGCVGSADVVVTSNGTFPTITVATPGQIDCNNSTIQLDATGSSTGSGYTIAWSTSNGNIVSGATTLMPIVDQGGTYDLLITDLSNGCEANSSVVVVQDTNDPNIDVGTLSQIDCNNPSITLGGPGTSTGPDFTYSWVANSTGTEISTSSTVTVNSADTYSFTVTDVTNGCSANQSVVVNVDNNQPTAVATGGGVIDCNNSTAVVSGSGSTTGMTYSWSASNGGNILSGGSSIDATVNAAGTYTLTVTDPNNGCFSVSSDVFITEDLIDPVADAGPDMEITCSSSTVILNGTGSSPGLVYSWTTTTGNIVSGANTLTPEVNQSGTYVLTVTNPSNGCDQTSNVNVTSNANIPNVAIATPADITCTSGPITLDGTGSSGGSQYSWTTTNGNIVSGSTTALAVVDAAGTYNLEVTDPGTGCSAQSSIVVVADDALPVVAINTPDDLTCTDSFIDLDGTPSTGGSDYSWTTSNGNIVSGANSATPTVDAPGSYTLTYTNTTNGCSDTLSVNVFEDIAEPTAEAVSSENIDCDSPSVGLSPGNSDLGGIYSVLWTTNDGNIMTNATLGSIIIDAQGTYTINITNTSNGCTASDSVFVQADLNPPFVDAGPDMDLTCTTTEVMLDGSNSDSGPDYTYQWTTTNGNITSGATTLTPTVDQGGTYTLTITSNINGCEEMSDVFVDIDNTVPVADAGPSETINCTTSTVMLNGNNSSPGLEYLWSTSDGNIVSGANTLTPTVDQEGTYNLLVTNPTNGCTAESSVQVDEFTDQPIAVIATPETISCDSPTITLDASGSTSGPTISYVWTTLDGNIVSNADTPNPEVDLAGTYSLVVIDNASLCEAPADVIVTGDAIEPFAVASASGNWDCASTSIELNAVGSDNGYPYIINWSTVDGNFTTQTDGLIAAVDTSGVYILEVTNILNNCSSEVILDVLNLVNYPSVIINDPGPINCSNPEVDITTTITNEGNNPTYSWTTTGGNIVTGASSSAVTVDAAGTYQISVVNSFNSCETVETIDITENSVYPLVEAGPTGELTCANDELTLDGTGTSTGTNYLYLWSTSDGNIVSGSTGLMPVVDLAGSYILSVTDTTSLCEISDTVVITSNQILPDVDAGPSEELNCTATEVILNGSTPNTGPDYTYLWTTANGNIISDDTTLAPTVDASGLYVLSVTDLINGCVGTDSVEVTVDANTPNADAGPAMVITCTESTVILDGTGSSSGSNFTYLWTTVDGNIVSGETTVNPEVDAGGQYTIEVTSVANGCSFDSNVTVVVDTIVPDVAADVTGIIDCNTPTLMLSGTGTSTGTDFTYQWTTLDGTIDSGSNTLDPTVSSGGTYLLSVADTTNTCTDSISVIVPENTLVPISDAGDTLNITCTITSVTLMGGNSDSGPDISYQWTTTSGSILGDPTSLNPEVNEGGVYVLLVSNTVNGCYSEDSTLVSVDADVPISDAGSDITLDCDNPSQELDGSASTSGPTIEYLWTTSNGNIISDSTSINPTVDAGGTYSLQVTDTSNGCEISSNVVVTDDTQLPTVIASTSGIVDCYTPTTVISGAGSSTGTEYTYQWTTNNGTIDSGDTSLDPTVSQGGTYLLTIIDTLSNCQDSIEVLVNENTVIPISEAGDSSLITCLITQVELDGSSSDSGADYTYQWTTSSGNIVTDPALTTIEVNVAGVYNLLVTNTVNGCTAEDSTLVVLDSDVPISDAGSDITLDCDNPSQELDGSASTSGPTIEYLWTTSNGNIISDSTSLNPTVDAGGTYSLQVTDTSNGCEISSDVVVVDDTDIPVVTANFTGIVDCYTPTVSISGAGSSTGTEYTYQWITNNGTIDNGDTTLDITVSQGGTYLLTIIDTLSNCQDSIDVTIPENTVIPTVDIGPDSALDCDTPVMTIDGSNSSSGTEFSYLWTTVDGNITSVNNTNTIDIDSGGVYVLTISNTQNGCVDSSSVFISQDFTLPQVSTDPGGEINCTDLTIPLVGQASGNTSNFVYTWQFSGGGSVSSGQGTLNAEASQPDMYYLVVVDTVNNCEAVDSVLVTQDSIVPVIVIQDLDTLDCSLTSITIDASSSSQGGSIVFTWETTNGQFDTGTNTLMPSVSAPGSYTLTLEDTSNDCKTKSSVVIEQDTLAPDILLSSSALIDCYNPSIPIDATVTANGSVDATWSASAGGVIQGVNTGLSVTVTSAGTYEVEVTDQSNGCTDTELLVVTDDLDNPILSAIDPDSISCPAPSVTLSTSVDTQGDPYTIGWATTASGSLDSDINTLTPTVSGAAPYTLTIQNSVNGCIDSLTVDVFGDLNTPTALAQVSNSLDCNVVLVDIDGSGSSSSGNFAYLWSTLNGNITSGQNSLLLQVDQPGDYTLLVEDLSNQCKDSVTVNVTQDIVDPTISLASTALINCFNPQILIDATINSSGTVDALWSANAGGIIDGSNTGLSISVSGAGTYQVEVTDQSNGCSSTELIDVFDDLDKPLLSAATPDSISCPQPSVTLSASVDTGGDPYDFTWSTNSAGSLDSGTNTLSPTVSGAASYKLNVQNNINGCVDSLVIDVFGDLDLPTVDAQVADFLSCSNALVDVDASGSSSSGTFSYDWSTSNGNIVSGQNTLILQVDQPGDYTLQVEDLSNSCFDTITVTVAQDITAPPAAIDQPDTITCGLSLVNLLGDAGLNPSPTYLYSWTTSNGNISSGTNTLNAVADQAGTYQLEVFDTYNGCSSVSLVDVIEDVLLPTANAGTAQTLDCNLTAQLLDGSASSAGSIYTYSWTTTNGNITLGSNSLNPTIDAPGVYELLVTNIQNQCTNVAQITVDQQVNPPTVEAGQNDTITCVQSNVQLSGVGSSIGSDFDYLWTSLNGNPINNQTQLDASVDFEGVYQLLVTDNSNGCSDSDLVIITIDTITPVLSSIDPDVLDCSLSETILTVNSSVIDNVSYSWFSTSGNIVSGANTANPIVNAAGVYSLQFVNLVNGCQAQEQITVLQDVALPTIDAGIGGTITCIELDYTAQGSSSTNSGQSTILWTSTTGTIDSGAGTLSPVFSAPGWYVMEVSDPINDCISVDSIEVLLDQDYPVMSPLSPQTLDCNNVVVTIDGSATSLEPQYQLVWTTTNGNFVSGNTTLSPVVDLEGNYMLTIIDTNNGCESFEDVTISSNFEYPDISAGLDIDLPCGVSSTSLEGTINGSLTDLQILWNALDGNIVNGSSTLTPTIDIGGTYSLSVLNTVNGCESSDTVSVIFDAPPLLSYLATEPACAGDFGSLDITSVTGGTPPFVYSINNGDTYSNSTDFGFLPAGEYAIIAQDVNGCETDVSLVSITEPPVFDVMVLDSVIEYQQGQQAQIIADPSYPLSAISSIVWSPPTGLSCVDCLDPVVTVQNSTTYFLDLVNASGCATSIAITVLVDQSANVFIANTFTPNSDGVNEVLMIQADITNIKEVKRFEVFDRWGELMFSKSNFPPNDPQYGWDGRLNGNVLNQGVYVYVVEVEMLDGRIELFKGDIFLGN